MPDQRSRRVGPGGRTMPAQFSGGGTVPYAGRALYSAATRNMSPDEERLYQEFGVNPGGKKRAANLRAALLRRDWDNYLQNFAPLEDRLVSFYNRPSTVAQSQEAVTDAFNTQAGIDERQRARYGLNLTSEQQNESERLGALSQTGALVSAANSARRQDEDRRARLLSGAQPSPARQLKSAGGS